MEQKYLKIVCLVLGDHLKRIADRLLDVMTFPSILGCDESQRLEHNLYLLFLVEFCCLPRDVVVLQSGTGVFQQLLIIFQHYLSSFLVLNCSEVQGKNQGWVFSPVVRMPVKMSVFRVGVPGFNACLQLLIPVSS